MFETWYGIVLFVLLCIVGIVLIAAFLFFLTSIIVFNITLVRTKKTKWSRACSQKNPEQIEMYNNGVKCSYISFGSMLENADDFGGIEYVGGIINIWLKMLILLMVATVLASLRSFMVVIMEKQNMRRTSRKPLTGCLRKNVV